MKSTMTKKQKSGAGAEGDYQLVQHEVLLLITSSILAIIRLVIEWEKSMFDEGKPWSERPKVENC